MSKSEKKPTKAAETGKKIQPAKPAQALSPFEEMDRWFESFYPRRWMRPLQMDWPSWGELSAAFEGRMPKVDVIDRDDEVIVRAEVPGVDKKDLDVSITESSVTIKGETSHESKEEKGDFVRSELSRGAFTRTVSLPSPVSAEKAKAKFKKGKLTVTLPKVAKTKRRTVTID